MTVDETPVAEATPTPTAAGAMLAAAREAAGLSVEAVAAQLKLAPRQVRALESGDFTALPGRTFVRGFVRNYARHLGIDAGPVLAALPDDTDPALSHPHLAGTHRPMGEIPAEHARSRSSAGWLIALALAALVAGAVLYEKWRPAGDRDAPPASSAAGGATTPSSAAPATPAALPADGGATSSQGGAPGGAPGAPASTGTPTPPGGGVPLPNPAGAPAGAGSVTPAPTAPSSGGVAPAPAASTTPGTTGAFLAASEPLQASTLATLELAFRGTSWVDVKDAHGTSLLTLTGSAGTSRSLEAAPPLDLVVGNAPDVDVKFRGASVDLKPWMRQNVARLTLR